MADSSDCEPREFPGALKCGIRMGSNNGEGIREVMGQRFRARLLAWYDANARDLPWRKDGDPYRVWVSEIMLQQTRVAAVVEHYHEFLRRFPTVHRLGAAREASVLAAWSGLGYYRRARMLHSAAKVIARDLGGRFPGTAEAWRELPGIGRYTAAAIASIAFGEAVAVVDGNVERVLQRIFGQRLANGEIWRAAGELLDHNRPGDFNQAMMELGATVCTPKAPACLSCPVLEFCATRGEMAGLTAPAQQKKREIHYALASRDGSVFLVRRPQNARLMPGMWELPEIASGAKAPYQSDSRTATLKRCATQKQIPHSVRNDKANGNRMLHGLLFSVRHSITVTDYTAHVWCLPVPARADGRWITSDRLNRIALTGLARKILRKAGAIRGLTWPHS